MVLLEELLIQEISNLKEKRLHKTENVIESPQSTVVNIEGKDVLLLCSNNYLGLASHPEVEGALKDGVEKYGFGMASVRFICGTHKVHKQLESRLASFHRKESSLTYSSCYAANCGLVPSIAGKGDVIFSDALNHASIIDAVRLSRAERRIYPHGDTVSLEEQLAEAGDFRTRVILTDGVFSMEGDIAPLPEIARIAKKYDAVTVVDDSHGTGVLGKGGRGAAEYLGVEDEIDIITSTLGKALGGAAGGYVVGSSNLTDYLFQTSRFHLFSNAIPPPLAYASIKAVEMVESMPELMENLMKNTRHFRSSIDKMGFNVTKGETPIIPVIVGKTPLALEMGKMLLDEGVYVTGFGHPVVPEGEARCRVQISAAHTTEQLNIALDTFEKVGTKLGVI